MTLRTDLAATSGATLVGFQRSGAPTARTVAGRLEETDSPLDYGVTFGATADDAGWNYLGSHDAPYVVTVPWGISRVNQIMFDTIGKTWNFNGSVVEGIATVNKSSVVDIRGGHSTINGMSVAVSAATRSYYECAVHWYTNDLSLYNPGYNDISGLQVTSAAIGLCIGALPSQTTILPQSGVAPQGEAIDAPLSESVVTNPRITDCIRAVYMRQPNGKVTIVGGRLHTQSAQWPDYPNPEDCVAVTVADPGSELTLLGGTIEATQNEEHGKLMAILDGRLNAIGCLIETFHPIYIDNTGVLQISNILDGGLNFPSTKYAMLEVGPNATKTATFADLPIVLPDGTGATAGPDLVTSLAGLGLDYQPNLNFEVLFRGCLIRDVPWMPSKLIYQPMVRGVRAIFRDCWIERWTSGVRTYREYLNFEDNLLREVCDNSFSEIPTSAQTSSGPYGGFDIVPNGVGTSFQRDTAGLPAIEGYAFSGALKLSSGLPGTECSAKTSKFRAKKNSINTIRGFFKVGNTTHKILIRVSYYSFSASAPFAHEDILNALESDFRTSDWQPLLLPFLPPPDAYWADILFYTESGATISILDLEVR